MTQELHDFSDLDDLLAEAVELKSAAANAKAARKSLSAGLCSSAERAETEAKIREWESRTEWKAAAAVAMFNAQRCSCGGTHTVFAGIFQRQEHKTSKVNRWIREETPAHLKLPYEHKVNWESVGICITCVGAAGFPTISPQ